MTSVILDCDTVLVDPMSASINQSIFETSSSSVPLRHILSLLWHTLELYT